MSGKSNQNGCDVAHEYRCGVGGNADSCKYGDDINHNGVCDYLGGDDIDHPLCKCDAAIAEAIK
jgi:hypothetical protein